MSYEGPPPTVPLGHPGWPAPDGYGSPQLQGYAQAAPGDGWPPVWPVSAKPPRRTRPWAWAGIGFIVSAILFANLHLPGRAAVRTRYVAAPQQDRSVVVGSPPMTGICLSEGYPKGASNPAAKFLLAEWESLTAQTALSVRMAYHQQPTPKDFADQVGIDRALATKLRAINYPASAASAVRTLLSAYAGYDNFLERSAADRAYFAANRTLDIVWANRLLMAEDDLRTGLDLQPRACRPSRP